jgi:hypothetical protein
MSQNLNRKHSLRKSVRPIIDYDEEDDNQRRDLSGRKRVDVVQCLLDSSSDELDDVHPIADIHSPMLWLTVNEICHIRRVLAQTYTSLLMHNDEKQCIKIRQGRLCFRCQKSINDLFFLPSFLRLNRSNTCFTCQQAICKNCIFMNFLLPSSKLSIPVRIQTLIQPASTSIHSNIKTSSDSNSSTRPICYDCLQVITINHMFDIVNKT